MNRLRKICALLLCLLLVLGMASCNQYLTVLSMETSTDNEKSMSYQKFSGSKSYQFTVAENEERVIRVAITTESGTLSAYIAKNNDKAHAVYQGTNIPTSEFTVTIRESGTYTIRLDADNHKGSYSFSW